MEKIKCKQCKEDFEIEKWKAKGHTTRCQKCRERHGKTNTRLYRIWENMKQRCNNEKNTGYINYGARGIRVCDEWKIFLNFEKWAVENGYKEDLKIDRIENNKGYEPNNCRWTNQTIQSRNVRQISKNNTTGYKGVSYRKDRKKYCAKITVNNIYTHLGFFLTAIDGARAYNKYVLENNLEHTLNKI